jgi:hypothetical protein
MNRAIGDAVHGRQIGLRDGCDVDLHHPPAVRYPNSSGFASHGPGAVRPPDPLRIRSLKI